MTLCLILQKWLSLEYPPNKDCMYVSAFMIPVTVDREFMVKCAHSLLTGMKACFDKQLADFLPGGKYGSEPSAEAVGRTTNSHLTNLGCERHFGRLDASQQRCRNASPHYHTSILMMKSHGTKMLRNLRNNPSRGYLWLQARKMGQELRKSHQSREKAQVQATDDNLIALRQKIQAKAAQKLLNQAKKRKGLSGGSNKKR